MVGLSLDRETLIKDRQDQDTERCRIDAAENFLVRNFWQTTRRSDCNGRAAEAFQLKLLEGAGDALKTMYVSMSKLKAASEWGLMVAGRRSLAHRAMHHVGKTVRHQSESSGSKHVTRNDDCSEAARR